MEDDLKTICVHCGEKVQGGINYVNSPIRIQFRGQFAHPSCEWEYHRKLQTHIERLEEIPWDTQCK